MHRSYAMALSSSSSSNPEDEILYRHPSRPRLPPPPLPSSRSLIGSPCSKEPLAESVFDPSSPSPVEPWKYRSYAMALASPSYAPSSVLLDVLLDVPYGAPRRNAFTARSRTSTGHPIEVTFNAAPARPPVLSHLSVHCPGLQLPPDDLNLATKVLATDADLILLRVPHDPQGKHYYHHNDYFVYRAHPQHPKLDLLPNACPVTFRDEEVAILSCGPAATAADGEKQYIVAALKRKPLYEFSFQLLLYRSKPGGNPGRWSFQTVSVEEPLRDKVCPIPITADRLMYHRTSKIIVVGGAKGTVGWVDLWRGILFCNLLEEKPKLQDMPLPLPARGNWNAFRNCCECHCRNITVNQRGDSIKYVEMEIVPPRKQVTNSGPEPVSFIEWLQHQKCPPQQTCTLVPGHWKATTWSMPILVASWDDWHLDCTAKLGDFQVDDPMHYQLLHNPMSGSDNNTEATFSLGCLPMSYPHLEH